MTQRPTASSRIATPLWVIAIVAALFLLQAAKSFFIPIVLAALISYALEPPVRWLERLRVPRLLGAGFVLLVILGMFIGAGYALKRDVGEVVAAAPETLDRVWRTVFGEGRTSQPGGTADQMAGTLVEGGVLAMFSFAGQFIVIFFLTYFLLVASHRVRDRMIEVAGPDPERRRTTSTIIAEINEQNQRYLLVLLVTGVIVGVATWLILTWLGVEHAPVWGILAGVFNSIPYFGPVVVSGGLFIVGMVQGGISQGLTLAGVSILITGLEGWLLTPALMGKAERMNALTVFFGLLLWTWLWGGWGTVLAVPMLAIIKSIADHVDDLKPLRRLMAQ